MSIDQAARIGAPSPARGAAEAPKERAPARARDDAPATVESAKKPRKSRAANKPKSAKAPPAAPVAAKPVAPPSPPIGQSAGAAAPAAPPSAPKGSPAPAASPGPIPLFVDPAKTPLPNIEALTRNAARFIEESGKLAAAYLQPREGSEARSPFADQIADIVATLGKVAERYFSDPQRAFQAQSALSKQFVALWASTLHRLHGETAAPVAPPDPSDKRFADPEWRDNPYYDFIKQAYVMTSRWAGDLVVAAEGIDQHTRDKAQFYVRQLSAALSPSNFLPTNPELMRATLAESGENLVRGLQMMTEDVAAGRGQLRIRHTDASKFELGKNMAATPGKVVFRNELIELIQYAPSTDEVFKRPLLIVPPWINKFYVLDLNPEKSFIRWAVAQGLTVFVVSWVNPDERHASKDFESYMREGILAALDAIEKATGETDVTAIGYCVGGTLLAVTLAYMAAVGDKRISSATFFAAQVDFRDPGDLKVFVDELQLKSIGEQMAARGYLEGSKMASAFNMLRPNDLIWSYFVNNYMKGKEPAPFDLLVWNSDSTRMPAANHMFYLRNCYLENNLTRGLMEIAGKRLDLSRVTIPIYNLAAREDHIAPAKSVFLGSQFFGGPVRYVLAGSGHIAGVVNPADRPKYQYWTGGAPKGDFADWLAQASETPGSWWRDWIRWIGEQAPEKAPARTPGAGRLRPLGDAPGEYVKAKS
ncbi:MAG TPA: class I poly(R)-hydroxyalkanoic acid synthase [Roseiarcus sp.]|nr:class I poly(R)-hydroxyalkanoic acid synthase [Roseiarcus sp.]